MDWIRANWFAVVVAVVHTIVGTSTVLTQWLSEGFFWSFLPPPP